MAVRTIYSCDICGAVKGQTNHWYLARAVYPDSEMMAKLVIERFNAALAGQNSILCGEQCIHKFISQNMNILTESTEREASSTQPPLRTFLGYEEIESPCTCEPGSYPSVNCEVHGYPQPKTELGIDRLLQKYKNQNKEEGENAL